MILCICNALTEEQVREAARNGAPTPRAAYRSLGCEPQCGMCLEHAREVIDCERSRMLRTDSRAA